jgi:DNA replication protein DnaC
MTGAKISDFLFADLDRIDRGEPHLRIEDWEGFPEYEDRFRENEAIAHSGNERAAQRQRLALELKDPTLGKFPTRIVNAALAPFDTSAMRLARQCLQSKKTVMVLAGGCGTGKSTAAAWMALEAGGSAPGFIRASELERRGRYSKTLESWIDSRSSLVVDDLGAEVLDGHGVFRSLLDEVIDKFYGDGRRLTITTNLHLQRENADEVPQFRERYGDRCCSRLSEVALWGSCGVRDLRRDQLTLVKS